MIGQARKSSVFVLSASTASFARKKKQTISFNHMAYRPYDADRYVQPTSRRPMPETGASVKHAPSHKDEAHDPASAMVSLESIVNRCPNPPQVAKDMASIQSDNCMLMIAPFGYTPTFPDRPPKSEYDKNSYMDFWDVDHVRMPCSSRNLDQKGKSQWPYICEELARLLDKCIRRAVKPKDLIDTIVRCAEYYVEMSSLEKLLCKALTEEENNQFMRQVLPNICTLALNVRSICGQAPPVLRTGSDISLTMSQEQTASLLACAFFCLFPGRSDRERHKDYEHFQDPNFASLYGKGPPCKVEKLKCILHYFRRVTEKMPCGVISFRRYALPSNLRPIWYNSRARLSPMHLTMTQKIEDIPCVLQVDFANKYIGGGVLGGGCVQEEIRFTICPEMLVSLLVCEVMADNECIFLVGCEQYCSYKGYGDQFQFAGNYDDRSPKDNWGRKWSHVVAMDAVYFRDPSTQYAVDFIDRELMKAYASFRPRKTGTAEENLFGIATGNWGCGVFKGDKELKAMIQLMAASEAQRPLIYCAFHDKHLSASLPEVYNHLQRQRATVGDLYHYLIQYSKRREQMTLFDFILRTPGNPSSKF